MTVDGATAQLASPIMTSADDVERLSWQPVAGCPGVSSKVLWRCGGSATALIAYRPRAHTPGAPHPDAVQHLWIASGQALIEGRWLPAGSYVHVPTGTPHPISASDAGCVLLQVHVPTWGAVTE